jgi:hypothetical protein
MKSDDAYEVPFDLEPPSEIDASDHEEITAAREAFARNQTDTDDVELEFEDDEQAVAAAQPYIGQWNQLVSETNWEKGRIICQWRKELEDLGASPIHRSDQAWVRRVGGVTAPHVGRLRRVYERFQETYESYSDLYWSHFLAALDWDDAPLWLEGASVEKWSVSIMRNKRWESLGAVASQRPTSSQIIEVDVDEDVVLPAQGGGKRKEYDEDGPGVSAGPRYDDPDFGDSDELVSLAGNAPGSSSSGTATGVDSEDSAAMPGPFKDLPDLPDDLADAIETLKLAVLRHKTGGWELVQAETIDRYLKAIAQLLK